MEAKSLKTPDQYVSFFTKREKNKLNVVDLFAGCGGLSLGFQRAGFNIVAGIDNDMISLETYKKNLNTKALNLDLGNSNFIQSYKDNTENEIIDVLIGGPPCQGFSLTGTRILNDSRNILFKAFFDFIDSFTPKIILLENVKGMKSLYNGKVLERILEEFNKRGYFTNYNVLNSSDFGVPQNRERLFILANNLGIDLKLPTAMISDENKITCSDAISDLHNFDYDQGCEEDIYKNKPLTYYQKLMRNETNKLFNHVGTKHKDFVIETIKLVPDGGNHKDLPPGVGTSRKFNEAWTRYSSNKPSKTIDTGHRNHFHYLFNRVPTVRENARLQSFPDDFVFKGSKTQQNKQVGNAVPVFLSQSIAHKILSVLENA